MNDSNSYFLDNELLNILFDKLDLEIYFISNNIKVRNNDII